MNKNCTSSLVLMGFRTLAFCGPSLHVCGPEHAFLDFGGNHYYFSKDIADPDFWAPLNSVDDTLCSDGRSTAVTAVFLAKPKSWTPKPSIVLP